MKAEFINAYYPKYEKYKALVYRYKNHEYTIYDYGMNGMTLWEQHKQEQNRIDAVIKMEEKSKSNEPTETAQEAFDFFWEYVNAE